MFIFKYPGSYCEKIHKEGRKIHCCYYCQEWIYRLPRHLKLKHKKEDNVVAILKLSRKQQNVEFAKLRWQGDFEANMKEVRHGDNLLAVVRKSRETTITNYSPCLNCFGMYNKRNIVQRIGNRRSFMLIKSTLINSEFDVTLGVGDDE